MPAMLRVLAVVAITTFGLVGTSSLAEAAPKKKYHFKLNLLKAKPTVAADVAAQAEPRVRAVAEKTFAAHPQLVAKLDGAPDPEKADAFRKYLKQKGIAGAYLVTIEITEATLEIEPMEAKPSSQRIAARLAIHLLGETIPGRTMGFTGDGQATIKLEVGKKIRDRDKEYAWEQATETAIAEAMTTVFKQLAVPPKKQ